MNKLLPSVKSLITLAALLCFLFQASAASAQKVSLSVRNATVKAAIERLQKDYGYSFVIKTKDADVNKKITLDVKNEEIGAGRREDVRRTERREQRRGQDDRHHVRPREAGRRGPRFGQCRREGRRERQRRESDHRAPR